MANVVVVGAQWGDEGKGKIVDWLSHSADIVVRFQGGHNAGHTLVIDETVYRLSLLPSGIVRPDTLAMIGNGVVIDPWALRDEIATLREQGISITPDNFKIAETATLILPIHGELDTIRETNNSGVRLGTTKRGIGPAYEDKVGRRALRIADLVNLDTLPDKIDHLLRHHNALRIGLDLPPFDAHKLYDTLCTLAPEITPYIAPVWKLLNVARRSGKRILFEGAQGALLDVDHGTYPYVTSSNTMPAQAALGSGIAPAALTRVLGITKAYTTRVGEGVFPTEQDNEIGMTLSERGQEFGTVTGRKRRCGWFDAVLVRQAIQIGGIDSLALTKLDVLDGFSEIKICTQYRFDGEIIDYLPPTHEQQLRIESLYTTLEGWDATSFDARSWADLPANAVRYVRYIEELVGVPITLLSTGPERDASILIQNPFDD